MSDETRTLDIPRDHQDPLRVLFGRLFLARRRVGVRPMWRRVVSRARPGRVRRAGWRLARDWYALRYGIPTGDDGSMLPQWGPGRFVSVEKRGPYIDITRHERPGDGFCDPVETIRLVPYQPNHGLMVECWRGGRLTWRTHADFAHFRAMWFGENNAR